MKRRVAIVLVGVVAMAGLGAGSAWATTPHLTEKFQFVQTNDGNNGKLLASGPISAQGKDVVVSDTQDRFVFRRGSLLVNHTPTVSHEHFNPKTCIFTFDERGTYEIVSGTGIYSGATGNGHYHAVGSGSGCEGGPDIFTAVIEASGPLHLPSPV